jgi:cobalt/nickel transport system permease protein
MLAALLTASILLLTIPSYIDPEAERAGILAMVGAHLPLALGEGVFTALVVRFLLRVSPGLLDANG